MLFEPCALSLSVSVSWCKWKAGLDLPMDFIKATVVSSLFLTTPKALPLSLPFPLSCGLGSWDLASPHEPPLPLLSPPLLPDGVVGFLPPLPGVVGVGLVLCVEGECSRNGTRNAPIPAAMRAAAPSVRLLGTIILFSYLPLFSDALPVWLYYSRNCTLKNLSIHSRSTSKSFRNRWWISEADILSEDSKEEVENQNIRNSH